MVVLLYSVVRNAWAVFFAYLLYDSLMEKKNKWTLPKIALLFLGIGAFFTITGIYFEDTYRIKDMRRTLGLLTRSIFSISASLVCFRGSLIKKVFSAVFAIVLMAVAELTGLFFYMSRSHIESIENITESGSDTISFIAVIVLYLYVLMIKWTRGNKSLSIKSASIYLIVMLITAASVCTLFYSYLYFNKRGILVVGTFIFWVNLTVYFLFNKLENYFKEIRDYETQEQHYRLRETYYQQMELHQKEIRTIKHDLQNQLISLSASYQNGLTTDENPLDPLIEQLSRQTECDFTGHPGINAVLGAKYRQAQQQSIVCKWEVKAPTELRFKDTDLAAVIGNILDNAIEACQYCSGTAYIQFQMIYHNGSLVINSENSTDEQAGEYKTRKKDKKNHGLGIESVRSIADKYHGEMQQSFSLHCYQIELTLFEPKIL